jgi:plastocyanin
MKMLHIGRSPRRIVAVARAVAAALPLLSAAAGTCAATVQVDVVDGAGKPLPGAVVFLDSPEAKRLAKPLPQTDMAQRQRRFVPDVLPVTVGTEVRFPNQDTVRHHVYSFSPAKKFELKLYAGTPANPVQFDQPGIVVLGCNIHDQMVGWVVVLETPYYALTGTAGNARLASVPPGAYRLRVWHSQLQVGAPAQEQPLTVAEGGGPVTVRMSGLAP